MKWFRIIISMVFVGSMAYGAYYIYQDRANLDMVKPELSYDDEKITASMEADDQDLLKGVTAVDEKNGDVSKSLLIENISKNIEGADNEFYITYAAFDSSGNSGRLTRTLYYEDYHKPHFSVSGALRFSQNENISLLDYIKAEDSIDGDVSPFIVVEGADHFMENPKTGIYDCTLQVTNSIGDTASLPIHVEIYEDSYEERTFMPKIILTQYILYLKRGEKFNETDYLDYINDRETLRIDKGPTVQTEEDGEIQEISGAEAAGKPGSWIRASRIKYSSDVDTRKAGNYSVVYTYTTDDGEYTCNAELIVVVE